MASGNRTPCEADQLLIEQVRLHQVLYAVSTKSNKDNQLRDTAWLEIADALGKSVEESKERWRYMRDKYVKDIAKYRHASAQENEVNETSFTNLMSFLNPFIKRKASRPNADVNSNHQDGDKDDMEDCPLYPAIEFISSVSEVVPNANQIKLKNEVEEISDSAFDDASETPPRRKRARSHDSTELFCASVAGMLRELPSFNRERIKRDIYNLVSDALISELARQNHQ